MLDQKENSTFSTSSPNAVFPTESKCWHLNHKQNDQMTEGIINYNQRRTCKKLEMFEEISGGRGNKLLCGVSRTQNRS